MTSMHSMQRTETCTHRGPLVVNAVEGGGKRAHCLMCSQIGPERDYTRQAIEALRGSPRGVERNRSSGGWK